MPKSKVRKKKDRKGQQTGFQVGSLFDTPVQPLNSVSYDTNLETLRKNHVSQTVLPLIPLLVVSLVLANLSFIFKSLLPLILVAVLLLAYGFYIYRKNSVYQKKRQIEKAFTIEPTGQHITYYGLSVPFEMIKSFGYCKGVSLSKKSGESTVFSVPETLLISTGERVLIVNLNELENNSGLLDSLRKNVTGAQFFEGDNFLEIKKLVQNAQ